MAARWSSEFNVIEHKDIQASTMAMNRNGDYILFAGKKYLALKNLNYMSDALRKFPRNSKYDVSAAEWNPTAFNSNLCCISTNQKIEIFTWKEADLDMVYSLKFHTRQVCNLNWHKFDPNLLASAGADCFTHIWDLRDLRKPFLSFSAIAAVNQVRWNKLTTHLLATAHDGDIRIWDQRKGTAPVQYLSPHIAKIHDLDWSQTHEYQLASCSQDGTVKFFDVTNPKCAESVIQTASPIWRAKYTPFGEGLVTVVVSLTQRGDNGLLLWNLSNQSIPVHTFVGHTDVVLEFEWRRNRAELSDYQLITWSKDQTLRIWRIVPFLQKLCGHELEGDNLSVSEEIGSEFSTIAIDFPTGEPKEFGAVETIIPAVEAVNEASFSNFDYFQYSAKRNFPPGDPSKCLELEFSHLSTNSNLSGVKFVEMNVEDRICVVTVSVNSHRVVLKISFPLAYPMNAAPSFKLDESPSIDDLLRTKILKILKQTAQQRVKRNRTCLESCLLQLITTLEHTVRLQETEIKSPSRVPSIARGETPLLSNNSYMYDTMQDVQVPYPKTCGARFCSVDKLVCFYQPSMSRRMSARTDTPTPRSFSAVSGNVAVSSHPVVYMLQNPGQNVAEGSVSYFMQDTNINRGRSLHGGNFPMVGKSSVKSSKSVTIYDCSKLFFADRELGEKYIFDVQNISNMCSKNAEIAGSFGRFDLVQVWTLAGLIATSVTRTPDPEDEISWTSHPFFKSQIENLIMHYAELSDIQTAAMLCCLFSVKPEPKGPFNRGIATKSVAATPGGSPYHTIHPADTSLEGWNFPATKHNRSNSWSDSLDDLKAIANILEYKEVSEVDQEKRLLDDKNCHLYDEFKKKYADILHRWNLLEVRTQVAKFFNAPRDSSRVMEFLIECQQCRKPIFRPPYCSNCRKIVLRCSLCRILVRGSSNFCFVCGHGGHTRHMVAWFETETQCPTGCGCQCLTENLSFLEN
ncbi:hypothetical protein RUM44_007172 [Polyplax serrata]|uniref:RWD domain-containing protein n=1 Tax=Polyplax serrata TaxID=468196 RepID=A0ABR1AZY4_POLSC